MKPIIKKILQKFLVLCFNFILKTVADVFVSGRTISIKGLSANCHPLMRSFHSFTVDNLTEDKRRRLVETIARIVCHQLNSQNASIIPLGSLIPWIVLHYILLR